MSHPPALLLVLLLVVGATATALVAQGVNTAPPECPSYLPYTVYRTHPPVLEYHQCVDGADVITRSYALLDLMDALVLFMEERSNRTR